LKRIIQSISDTAKEANVKIVTGDTKVVNRGKADKIFINTSGIGVLNQKHEHISYGSKIISGDKIIINGTIADHGTAILSARENLGSSNIKSDCAPLNNLVSDLLNENINIKFMRDATRGGLGTVLKEIANENFGIMIEEEQIKIKDEVRGLCEIVGFDPLFLANEGKIVFIISSEDSEKAIKILRKNKYGTEASIIGEITSDNPDKVILNTSIGGRRMIDMLAGEQLPRIC
jgi:hydrogenase expression/formation protein HypE